MDKSFEQWTPADRERVLSQLNRILGSRTFAAASRLQELLKYLVTEAVSGRGNRLNQASIAIDVLGRDEKFDPAVDSVVRVEAGRLRGKLRDYYQDEGPADPVRIELPKGLYLPRFRFDGPAQAPAATPAPAAAPIPPTEEMTPKRTARRQAMQEFGIGAGLTLIVIVAWLLGDKFADWRADRAAVEVSGTAAESAPDFTGAKSLAVLPFLNSSAAAEDAGFFADGLHDDLLTQLTKIADLKVISRTSVMGYRDVQKPIPQIAEELGVHAVLEGAVQRAGDRVRVNVQLIDGRTDKHLWAESFDQELNATNIFEIQRRIAMEIATALHATLSPQEQTRLAALPTQSFEAYEAYLKGRQRLARRTLEDIRGAVPLFEQAVAADPGFALAHVGIAEAYSLLNSYGGIGREEMIAKAKPALDRAFALNDQIGEAWTVLGHIRNSEGDPQGAEEAFLRAIELNPNYAQAWHWYSNMLGDMPGRSEKQLELARRARELDPLSPLLRANLALALEGLGRFDEAEAEVRRGIDLDPEFAVSLEIMAYLKLLARQDAPEAMRWFARSSALGPSIDAEIGMIEGYLMLGDTAAAAPRIERAKARVPDQLYVDLWNSKYEYAFGDRKLAAKLARALLKEGYVHIAKQKPSLLRIVRGEDLAAGRQADARDLYAAVHPELVADPARVTRENLEAAVDLALVLQKLGENDRAARLLDGVARLLPEMSRTGSKGYRLADVHIAALRGDKQGALAALRRAIDENWRWYWIDRPDLEPNLALLHGDPEFEALLAEVQGRLREQLARVRALETSGEIPPPSA
jgi:TolB-like protein